MDDTTSPPKFRTKYKYGKKKHTQHLAKILKQRKVEESTDSDSHDTKPKFGAKFVFHNFILKMY